MWREDPQHAFSDFRITRLTFGVSASSFAANVAMKQDALNHQNEYPKAVKAVVESFYVDDGLPGAGSVSKKPSNSKNNYRNCSRWGDRTSGIETLQKQKCDICGEAVNVTTKTV